MNTCKTCKWWTHDALWKDDHGLCKHPQTQHGCNWSTAKDYILGCPIATATGGDFGCIHHSDHTPADPKE